MSSYSLNLDVLSLQRTLPNGTSIGLVKLPQALIKHLLSVFNNHHFDHQNYSPRAQLFTTAPPRPLLPLVTMASPQLHYWMGKTPLSLSGQPICTLLLLLSSHQWPP